MIDLVQINAAPPSRSAASWTAKDVQLYNLAIGAARDPLDEQQLTFALEDRLVALPTFAVIAGMAGAGPAMATPGLDFERAKMLHGSQSIVLDRPVPVAADVESVGRVAAVYDKGSAAVAVLEVETFDQAGVRLFTNTFTMFLRDAGGFGGDPGPRLPPASHDRPADRQSTVIVEPNQALLYRLCGDTNPLHADPAFAQRAGFPRPILHGLCTWGMTCRELIMGLLDGDAAAVRSWDARFVDVVYPGETLQVSAWVEPNGIEVEVRSLERDSVVLAGGRLTTSTAATLGEPG
ncbi:MAG: MaoC/PaaZ C-terminal domain-containing protein [Ilumatobacteraceae bacterium]